MIFQWIVSALSLLATAYFLPGFEVKDFGSALITAVVIGLASLTIRPLLLILTFPINVLTFGLFTWVVNAIVLKICAAITPGFAINSWGAALLGSVLITVFSNAIYWLFAGGGV